MKRVLLFVFALLAFNARACIVYKDIKPDSIVRIDHTDPNMFGTAATLDLNNDANPDFIFLWMAFPGAGWNVSIIPADTATRFVVTGTDTVSIGGRIATPLVAGTAIGTTNNWATSENGASVVDSAKRNFAGLGDRYIGVRLSANGKYYYGWVLVAFDSVGGYRRVVVKSHALQNTSGVAINVGDTGTLINTITAYGTGGVNSILKTATLQMTTTVSPSGIANQGISWKVNDTNLATITAAGLLKPKNIGKVKVTATDTCSGKSDDTTITITLFKTGIDNLPTANELRAYPNPVQDVVYIESTNDVVYDKAELRGFDGRVIHTYQLNNTVEKIDVKDLAAGLYYMLCTSTVSQKQHVLRIQKQ